MEWFDSEPERAVANMIDADEEIACWVRLHIKELPILWNSGGQQMLSARRPPVGNPEGARVAPPVGKDG